MHRLEVTSSAAMRAALRNEGKHSPQSRFVHRLHCLLLVGTGQSCYQVAEVFGDNPRSFERWVCEFQQHGIDGLREKQHPGRQATLADAQMQQLALALKGVPRELGYAENVWNNQLLRAEILRRFGVALSARHCQRLFKVLQPLHP